MIDLIDPYRVPVRWDKVRQAKRKVARREYDRQFRAHAAVIKALIRELDLEPKTRYHATNRKN